MRMKTDMKNGWEIKKLGEVADYFNGLTYSPKDVNADGTIVLRSSNIQNDILDFSDIVRVSANVKEKLFIKEGDILMCSRNGSQRLVGKTAPILNLKEPMTFGTFMMIIRSEMSPYLLWFFKTDEFKKKISGGENTMINQVTRYMLDDIEIPIPPLPEQQRIVSILDEAFAAIAVAKTNAELNLKNAKELFESYLQGVFEKKGEGWEEKTLKEITTKIGSGATPRGGNESYKTEGISLVRSMNVHDFEFRPKKLAFIDDQQAKELNNVTLQENDVLLNITGASVARCCIIPKEYLPARVNQHVSIIRAKKEVIDSSFLNLILTSKFYKDQLLFTGEQGATRQAITKVQLELFKIAYPKSLKDQQTIVQKLDALSDETKRLEDIYRQKILDLEELKKSVLQKAFNGEL